MRMSKSCSLLVEASQDLRNLSKYICPWPEEDSSANGNCKARRATRGTQPHPSPSVLPDLQQKGHIIENQLHSPQPTDPTPPRHRPRARPVALVHCPRPLVPRGFNALDAPGGPREERPQVRLGQAPRVRPRVGVRITKTADVEPASGPDDPGELRDVAPLHLVVKACVKIKFRTPHAIDAMQSPELHLLDDVKILHRSKQCSSAESSATGKPPISSASA